MGKLAAFLSIIVSGLGQAYNRQYSKALIFFMFVYLSILIAVNSQSGFLLLFALMAWVWAVFDAYKEGDFLLTNKVDQLLAGKKVGSEDKRSKRLKRFEKTQKKLDKVISVHERVRLIKKSPEAGVVDFIKKNDSGDGIMLDQLKSLNIKKSVLFNAIDLLIDAGKIEEIEKNVFKLL
ncbi:MAG: hypothetical protein GOU97_04920 [Nanoarchaeota archaeon]|nr:hypothetical protein [Nanoarchaeota archaeon]